MIPEAQRLDALFREKLVSLFVARPLVWKTVPAAIEFDCQLRDGAVENKEIDAAGILAAELEFIEAAVTEQTPEPFFGFGGMPAELAGKAAGSGSARAMFAVLG